MQRTRYLIHHIIYYFLICLAIMGQEKIYAVPLPAEDAFVLKASILKKNEIELFWRIAPNYYLYATQMQINFEPSVHAPIHLPQGTWRYDTIRGRFEAYSGEIRIPIVFENKTSTPINLQINYQGCSADGFCYPPIERNMTIDLAAGVIQEAGSLPKSTPIQLTHLLTDQNSVQQFLSTAHSGLLLPIFFVLGLLLAFTPCVLPMIPILASIIAGQKNPLQSRQAFLLSFSYVLGAAVTYALAGLLAAALGATLQIWLQQPWIIAIAAGLFVVLALSLFGLYELRIPAGIQQRIVKWTNQQTAGTYFGVFCMGILSTLIVSPCVTAPLVGVLMYIAQTGNKWFGGMALFTMGMGMGVPLLLVGVSAGRLLPKSGSWMIGIKKMMGFLMIAMSIWLVGRISPAVAEWTHLSRFMFKQEDKSNFILVQNIEDLNQQLLLAKNQHQPVLLDFYADWCDACVSMDSQVFAKTAIKEALSHYKLLRIDLTANTLSDERLMKYFHVIAPPTVLFFDTAGIENASKRVVGELSSQEFLVRLQSIR